jgi:hypothetical protein
MKAKLLRKLRKGLFITLYTNSTYSQYIVYVLGASTGIIDTVYTYQCFKHALSDVHKRIQRRSNALSNRIKKAELKASQKYAIAVYQSRIYP